jgi:hypothetical protein
LTLFERWIDTPQGSGPLIGVKATAADESSMSVSQRLTVHVATCREHGNRHVERPEQKERETEEPERAAVPVGCNCSGDNGAYEPNEEHDNERRKPEKRQGGAEVVPIVRCVVHRVSLALVLCRFIVPAITYEPTKAAPRNMDSIVDLAGP